MPPNEHALAQLRDIHLPAPIGLWPLAVGWVVLAALLFLVFFMVTWFAIRHYHAQRGRRQALSVLARYQQENQRQPNSQLSAARVSELLKRVALLYYPRTEVASLQGDAWVDFLNKTANNLDFNTVRILLIERPYQPPQSDDITPLFIMAQLWIQQRRGQCLN